jgi:hypothetical protein
MKAVFALPVALLLALSVPALAQNGQGQNGTNQGQNGQGGGYRGAPGPVVGAGLPVLLIIGGGIYWLVRRRKRTS